MKCIACHRPLLRYAASTPTRAGIVGWGPKCAARAGVTVAATKLGRVIRAQPVVDETQLALEWEA